MVPQSSVLKAPVMSGDAIRHYENLVAAAIGDNGHAYQVTREGGLYRGGV
jgi:hypothetical protein